MAARTVKPRRATSVSGALLAIALSLSWCSASAGVFQCVSDDGSISFSDRECPQNDRQTKIQIGKQDVAISQDLQDEYEQRRREEWEVEQRRKKAAARSLAARMERERRERCVADRAALDRLQVKDCMIDTCTTFAVGDSDLSMEQDMFRQVEALKQSIESNCDDPQTASI